MFVTLNVNETKKKKGKKMRWGICGSGFICHDFCTALQLLNQQDHQIAAVADIDINKAQRFADEFKVPKAFGCHEDMAREPTVDVVYIGVINIEHCRLSLMMLNNGKHVLCEKPVTMNLKQLEKVLKVAQERKCFFMEALWSRFFPTYEKVRNTLDSQSLGKVLYLEAECGIPIIGRERIQSRELGGGGLFDIGVYVIHLAHMTFKEKPEQIIAVGHLHTTGVDKCASIILKYKEGKMANLMYHTEFMAKNCATIYGTEGQIEIHSPFWCPTKVTINNEEMEFPLPATNAKFNHDNSAGLSYEAEFVRRCIQEGNLECPLYPHSESIALVTIMDEVRRQIGVKYDVDDIELE